jgi:two-component system alkaline phosphatase synthesis response regulator PhoP
LVVDDEADVRNFLKAALTESGFTVVTAADGFEALDLIRKKAPDLISLDLVMPRKSGAALYRELCRDKGLSKIPVIVVTGHAHDDLGKADLKELTMSGPGIYLEKPVKPHNYIAAVKRVLGLESTSDESATADQIELQTRLKSLIDNADPDTLASVKRALENGKKEND